MSKPSPEVLKLEKLFTDMKSRFEVAGIAIDSLKGEGALLHNPEDAIAIIQEMMRIYKKFDNASNRLLISMLKKKDHTSD